MGSDTIKKRPKFLIYDSLPQMEPRGPKRTPEEMRRVMERFQRIVKSSGLKVRISSPS